MRIGNVVVDTEHDLCIQVVLRKIPEQLGIRHIDGDAHFRLKVLECDLLRDLVKHCGDRVRTADTGTDPECLQDIVDRISAADTVAVGRTVDQNVDVLQRTQHIVYRLAAQFRTAVTGLLHRNTSLLMILLQISFFGIVLLRRLCGLAAEPAGQTEAA